MHQGLKYCLSALLSLNLLTAPASAANAPLQEAIQQNKPARVIELIRKGLPANSRVSTSQEGPFQLTTYTVEVPLLSWAVVHQHLELARLLIQKGASPDSYYTYVENETGLVGGSSGDHYYPELREIPLLLWAFEHDDLPLAQFILQLGANPDLIDRSTGQSLLVSNVAAARIQAVKFLLAHGAKANLAGQSPLVTAAERGDLPMIKLLLEHHSQINQQDAQLASPVMKALACPECLQRLLAARPNLDLQDQDGKTALIRAVQSDQEAAIRQLLQSGAQLQPKDKSGNSALSYAIASKDFHLMSLLSQSQAIPAALQNYIALMLAIEANRSDQLKSLLKPGLDLNFSGPEGQTPLIFAVQKG
ncbi:MAG: ankyrin repeat domain-containing protein, partial [Candidatus Sericytochromatia bacterium]